MGKVGGLLVAFGVVCLVGSLVCAISAVFEYRRHSQDRILNVIMIINIIIMFISGLGIVFGALMIGGKFG